MATTEHGGRVGMEEMSDAAVKERPGEIFRLENALENLTSEIEGLEVILEPVMSPPTPEAVLEAKREAGSRLGDRVDRLENLIYRLSAAKRRITL